MRRIVYVIEVDVPEHKGVDPYHLEGLFGDNLVAWSSYFPQEDNAPIRVNISYEGVEEV